MIDMLGVNEIGIKINQNVTAKFRVKVEILFTPPSDFFYTAFLFVQYSSLSTAPLLFKKNVLQWRHFISNNLTKHRTWFLKFYKILLHQIAPIGLANWTKKVFPVFLRNMPKGPKHTGPKGPPFNFFGTARIFGKKFPPKGPPSIFFCCFAFRLFSAVWDFFPKIKIFPPSIFWCFATEWMLKNPKGSPLSVFRHCETFFSKIIFSPKGPPSISLIFYNRLGV